MSKTIFTGFAPNMDKADIGEALAFLLLPWRWKQWQSGSSPLKLEAQLAGYLDVSHVIALDSGRTALYAAMKALDVHVGDEVIVQSFTCVVVTNAIRYLGATPVFVDINESYTADPTSIAEAITDNTKAIIVQHTFGTPADIEAIIDLAHTNGIAVIEDCAHAVGARHNGKLLGTLGDVSIMSFGSDKVISSVRGGAVVTNREDIAKQVRAFQSSLPKTSRFKIFQHLIQYPLFYLGKTWYHIGIGKWVLALAKKTHLLYRFVYTQEKHGKIVPFFPSQLANALATIGIAQLQQIDEKNRHRKKIAQVYADSLPRTNGMVHNTESLYLRYPLFVSDRETVLRASKEKGIILGNWYDAVIAPKDIDPSITGYVEGSCPQAEYAAAHIINLPTNQHITPADALRIATLLKPYV